MNDAVSHSQQNSMPLDHSAIRAIMLGIMLAMFLSALEQTIVAPALPTIGRTLGVLLTDIVIVAAAAAFTGSRLPAVRQSTSGTYSYA